MSCELELDGVVAVLRTVVHDPEFEGQLLNEESRLPGEIYAAVRGMVTEQFGGRIELSPEVEIERGSVVILMTLVTVGRVIIEYGALMAGLRELSRLIPDRIRRILGRRHPFPMRIIEPPQVILGPTVLVARPAKRRPVSSAMTVALSAVGGAALIVAGVLLGHFL